MPYAASGKISQLPIDGGVEISEEQYQQLLAVLTGQDPDHEAFRVANDEVMLLSRKRRTVYGTADGSKKEIHDNEPAPEGYTDEERPSRWHEWNGSEWVEDAAAHLEDARGAQIQAINDAYSAAVAPLIKDYPQPEPLSWAHQDAEAQAYLVWHAEGEQGDPPATPVLDRILTGRNGDAGTETMLELCEAVERNAEMFRQAQELTGRRQRLVRAVRAAETVEEVEAVVWPE